MKSIWEVVNQALELHGDTTKSCDWIANWQMSKNVAYASDIFASGFAPATRNCFLPPCRCRTLRLASSVRLLQVGVARQRAEQNGGLSGGLPEGPGIGTPPSLRHPRRAAGRALPIRKLWWFSSRMVMSWKTVKARRTSTSVKLRFSRLELRPLMKRTL